MFSIMIIDDNHLSVEGICMGIDWKSLDARVDYRAFDGRMALDLLKAHHVDLIISDIEMPRMTGLELSKEALALHPYIKIVLISAFDKFEYAKEAVRIGAFDYIEKPINYDYLTKIVSDALEQIRKEEHNRQLLKHSRPAMLHNFFQELVTASVEDLPKDLDQYPAYLNLDLNCHFYLSCIIRMENAEAMKSSIGIQEYHIRLLNLQDDLNERFKGYKFHYILSSLNQLVLILGVNYAYSQDLLREIHEIFAEILQSSLHRSLEMTIGIGTVATHLYDLHHSYSAASKALEYCFFFPQKNIFDVRDIGTNAVPKELTNDSSEEQLIHLLCEKDRGKIQQWLSDFSETLLSSYRTKSLVFIRIYSICGRIIKLLCDIGMDASDIEREVIHAYAQMDSFTTASQIFGWLNTLCETAVQKMEAYMQDFHDQICLSVSQYIQEHYGESTLNLNELAAFVNVSPAHLSALFKKHEGITISDSISAARLDAACLLLKNSTVSIREISEKCGYANQYYFSSAFKKKIGMTPSEYREHA